MPNGVCLRFFVHQTRRHKGKLVHEWLLEEAERLGMHGGSAFRAIAGFGRHGVLHEEHFFELAGDVPVEVVFVFSTEEAERLLEHLRAEALPLFYVRMPAEFGVLNSDNS